MNILKNKKIKITLIVLAVICGVVLFLALVGVGVVAFVSSFLKAFLDSVL